jgi:hypothetical protein
MTAVLNTLFFIIFIPFPILFVLGPVYGIYKRGFETMIYPALVCWGISALILIPAVRYYIKRKTLKSKIVVDETGLLFYNAKNEIADQILYKDLRPSKQNFDIYTVNPVGSGIAPLLEITIQSGKKEETIRRIDMNLPLKVVKNKYTLYAHFLRGIVNFRPDVKVDPMVFRSYSIDTETWKVNSRGVSLGGWLLILTAFMITALICGFVFLLSETNN